MGSATRFKVYGFKCRSLLPLSFKVMRRTAILTPWCQRCFVSLVLTACGRKDPVKAAMIAAKPPWPDQCHRFWPLNSFWIYRTSQRCARGACKALRGTYDLWKCSDVWQRCVCSICLHATLQLRWWTSLNYSVIWFECISARFFLPCFHGRICAKWRSWNSILFDDEHSWELWSKLFNQQGAYFVITF